VDTPVRRDEDPLEHHGHLSSVSPFGPTRGLTRLPRPAPSRSSRVSAYGHESTSAFTPDTPRGHQPTTMATSCAATTVG